MNNKRQIMSIFLVLVMALLAACAPKQAPAPAPQAPVPAAAPTAPTATVPMTLTKPAWQVKWDSMVEGAKKEGKVVVYSSAGAETRAAVQQAFKDRFGIGAEFISGQSAELPTKIMAERRAGLSLVDVLVGGTNGVAVVLKPAGVLEPIEVGGVLLLPDLNDPKLWLGGKLAWQDASTHLSLQVCKVEIGSVARNTELVKDGEIQSYNDLLNPKWKAKIIMWDPTKGGGGLKAIGTIGRFIMGWDYLRALTKQEPLIISDLRLQVEWLARGKYALALGYKGDVFYAFKSIGMPVDTILVREGGRLDTGSGVVSLLKNAAHPNAARLFINWLLTKEGATAFARSSGFASVRLDVSDEGLLYRRPTPDSKAPDSTTEEAILKQDEDLKIIREIFLPFVR